MITRAPARCAALLAAAAALYCAAPASAQVGGTRPTSNGVIRRQAPTNFNGDLKTLADAVGTANQTRIVVDPLLLVPAKPTAPAGGLALDKALDALVAQGKNGAWRRVYLPVTQAAALPAANKIAASVRALETLEQTGLVIEDPAAHRATSFLKGFPATPGLVDDLAAQQFSRIPIYVIYSTAPYALPPAQTGDNSLGGKMLDLQRQQMDLMMQMTPDQMSQAMAQGMQMFMNLDPAVRQQYLGNMMRSGMQMFMNMAPQQRQELLNAVMQNAQGMFGAGGPGGPPASPAR